MVLDSTEINDQITQQQTTQPVEKSSGDATPSDRAALATDVAGKSSGSPDLESVFLENAPHKATGWQKRVLARYEAFLVPALVLFVLGNAAAFLR